MLKTRPHVAALKCNRVRAHADLGDMQAAERELAALKASNPHAPCVALSNFVYLYKAERFPEAMAAGQAIIRSFDSKTKPEVARYVVDTTYRCAIRVPALEDAISILKVRAERWADLRVTSWLLIGQLEASRSPAQPSPAALDAFRTAVAAAPIGEQAAVLSRIPENYRARLR
jgi:hypothetical protein